MRHWLVNRSCELLEVYRSETMTCKSTSTLVDDGATVRGSNALSGAGVRQFQAAALCLVSTLHVDGPCSWGISAPISSRTLQHIKCFDSNINKPHRRPIIVPFVASLRHHRTCLTRANYLRAITYRHSTYSRNESTLTHLRSPQLTTKSPLMVATAISLTI